MRCLLIQATDTYLGIRPGPVEKISAIRRDIPGLVIHAQHNRQRRKSLPSMKGEVMVVGCLVAWLLGGGFEIYEYMISDL